MLFTPFFLFPNFFSQSVFPRPRKKVGNDFARFEKHYYKNHYMSACIDLLMLFVTKHLETQSHLQSTCFLDAPWATHVARKSLRQRSATDKKDVAPIDAKRLSTQTKKSWKRAPAHPRGSQKPAPTRLSAVPFGQRAPSTMLGQRFTPIPHHTPILHLTPIPPSLPF